MAFEKKPDPMDPAFVAVQTLQAAAELKKGATAFAAAAAGIDNLAKHAEDLSLQIQTKEKQIKDLETSYAERQRQADIDLKLKSQENIGAVVTKHLVDNKLTSIGSEELDTLRKELATLKKEYMSDLAKQVAIEVNAEKRSFEQEKLLLTAQHNQKEAENVAKINSLEYQTRNQEVQIKELIKQLDSERQAGIERAKAAAPAAINIGGGK